MQLILSESMITMLFTWLIAAGSCIPAFIWPLAPPSTASDPGADFAPATSSARDSIGFCASCVSGFLASCVSDGVLAGKLLGLYSLSMLAGWAFCSGKEARGNAAVESGSACTCSLGA